MKEYLLFIRTEGDYCLDMTPEQHQLHLEKVGQYIQRLKVQGKLVAAQPLSMNGGMVQRKKGVFKDGPFVETKEIIIGYFHILAKDLDEAREIARENPVFEDTDARIEVREIKKEEGIN